MAPGPPSVTTRTSDNLSASIAVLHIVSSLCQLVDTIARRVRFIHFCVALRAERCGVFWLCGLTYTLVVDQRLGPGCDSSPY